MAQPPAARIAAVARPPLWLEILIILWAMPPALMGLGCAAEILAILSNKLFDGSSTWKWMDDRGNRDPPRIAFTFGRPSVPPW